MTGRLAKTILATAITLSAAAPAAQGAVNFFPAVEYAAEAPNAIATGDFNGDGIPDLATVGEGTNATVLLGTGDGSFTAAPSFAVTQPRGIAAGPLDANPSHDLAVARGGAPGDLERFLSNGDGTFGSAQSYPAGHQPQDVALGRIDPGETLDAAVPNSGSNSVTIFRNPGDGSFADTGTPVAVTNPQAVAFGDFNADGDNDLAVATTADIYVADNDGTGTFVDPRPLNTDPSTDVTVVDVDANGFGDVVGVKADGDLAVVRSSGGTPATFLAPLTQAAGGGATGVAAGDLDSDGTADLAVSNSSGAATALIGRRNGQFDPAGPFDAAGNPQDVVIGDFNRDGNPDVAIASPSVDRVLVFRSRPPDLVGTPSPLDFGGQPAGTPSDVKTFTLRNNGPPRALLTSVALTGAGEFSIVSNNCEGANLGIGEACQVGVRFTPTALGAREARLTIGTHNGGGPRVVPVLGLGANPALRAGNCANDRNGTNAADTLNGTDAGDNVFGFLGNDVLNGLAGNDCLIGGPGNDRMNGGDGTDTLEGNSGNDVALGGAGNDRANGGSGRDRISGGTGNDRLSGVSGNDSLSGGAGNDTLSGSSGNDKLTGGSGKNRYSGGSGNDTINARNRRHLETVDCGPGLRDRATVDRRDRVKGCERVTRR